MSSINILMLVILPLVNFDARPTDAMLIADFDQGGRGEVV